MERKLASIQRVAKVTPIYVGAKPADKIEQIWILGYRSIAQKGQFKEGDLCIFIEMDSVLDPNQFWVQEYASFMEKNKWRVRMMKLNKMRSQRPNSDELVPTFSQGLVMPFNILPKGFQLGWALAIKKVGTDVTNLLGITKFEEPQPVNMGYTAGNFPQWMRKTDEHRVQSYPELLEEMRGLPAYATQKIDGSSVTIWCDADGTVHVASRNFERADGDNVYWNAVRPYLGRIMTVGERYCFQGEAFGEGIQGNPLGMKGIHFLLFSIYDRKQCEYLGYHDEIMLCNTLQIPHVPVVYEWKEFYEGLAGLGAISKGVYQGTTNPQEGIVVRPFHHTYSPTLAGRLSFKYINPDFLLWKG